MYKKYFVFFSFTLLVTLCLSGCFTFRERTYPTDTTDTFFGNYSDFDYSETVEPDVVDVLERWINRYNESVDDEFSIINPIYMIGPDCFYIKTGDRTYSVTLDESGEVILFSLKDGSVEDKITVANTWLSIIKTKYNIPSDMFDYIQSFREKHSEYKDDISKFILEYHAATSDVPNFY